MCVKQKCIFFKITKTRIFVLIFRQPAPTDLTSTFYSFETNVAQLLFVIKIIQISPSLIFKLKSNFTRIGHFFDDRNKRGVYQWI